MTIWCRYEIEGKASYGLIEDDQVTQIRGTPFGPYNITSIRHALKTVKLLVPAIPNVFYCAGFNYADHVIKVAKRRGEEPKFPTVPDIGYRAVNALIAHEENIVKPKDSGELFQYEGELVVVFGKKAKKVSKDEALDCVLGWTVGNDISERTWQRGDRTFWRGKNSDTFKPMGPWIVTGLDPAKMETIIRVNGTETDRFATGNMLFDVATSVSEVSRYCTIQPGDVMWMGTDGQPQNIKVGDTVEIEITGIGTLRNRVVAE